MPRTSEQSKYARLCWGNSIACPRHINAKGTLCIVLPQMGLRVHPGGHIILVRDVCKKPPSGQATTHRIPGRFRDTRIACCFQLHCVYTCSTLLYVLSCAQTIYIYIYIYTDIRCKIYDTLLLLLLFLCTSWRPRDIKAKEPRDCVAFSYPHVYQPQIHGHWHNQLPATTIMQYLCIFV